MKKSFLMLGATLAALTSCTQSEVLEIAQSNQIGFDTFVGKTTKAATDGKDVTNDDTFNSFYVYCGKGTKSGDEFTEDTGGHYMDGVAVKRTDANSPWTYATPQEWIINKYYRFAAYSNGHKGNDTTDDEGNTTVNTDNKLNTNVVFKPTMSTTVKDYNDQGSLQDITVNNVWGLSFTGYEASDRDLVAATSIERNTINANAGQASVNFSFAHLLAKVRFRFSYYTDAADAAQTKVYVKPFNLVAIKKGNCDVFHDNIESHKTYVNWNTQYTLPNKAEESDKGDYTYFPGTTDVTVGTEKMKATEITEGAIFYDHYVIPQKNTFNLSGIEVLIYKNNTLTAHYTYNNVSLGITGHEYWRPGYVYRYEANLNANKQYIEFTASVDNWVDTSDRDAIIGGDVTTADDEENN